jgi:pyruvate dehydrogenase E2 component (dihydrolipoamide acetyltransferase)
MIREIFMPALSSTMTEGKITSWVKSPGDKVEKGETVVIVESDKADMDVESFYEGYLGAIAVPEGEVAPVGAAIAYVAETEAEIEAAKQKAAQSNTSASSAPAATNNNASAAPTASAPASATTTVAAPARKKGDRIIASPRAKKLAKANNLDLGVINGTGPNGRITAADVEALLKPTTAPLPSQPAPSVPSVAAAAQAAPPPMAAIPTPTVASSVQPFTTFQNAVVRNMTAGLTVPSFRVGYVITTTALDALYKQIKSKGVTMTTLLAKAVALTLQKHPLINASYTEQGIAYKSDINIAVAVAMDDGGLITPVLPKADQIDIYSLSRHWRSLVERARAKQLKPEEYNTGTIIISNLGMFGVDSFDPILQPGNGAILAIGGSKPQPVITADGAIAIRSQMKVNITCDHRVIYGAHAAMFLQDLAKLIENDIQSLVM